MIWLFLNTAICCLCAVRANMGWPALVQVTLIQIISLLTARYAYWDKAREEELVRLKNEVTELKAEIIQQQAREAAKARYERN